MNKTMLNVKGRIDNLKDILSDVIGSEEFCNYSGDTYVSDAITEIADSNTSIYYSDIIKFISEHVDDVNDTIQEFGWDGCGCDLYKAGQLAEMNMIENELNENLDAALALYAYDYLRHNGIDEVSEEFDNELMEFICDGIDTFWVLTDFVDKKTSEVKIEDFETFQALCADRDCNNCPLYRYAKKDRSFDCEEYFNSMK